MMQRACAVVQVMDKWIDLAKKQILLFFTVLLECSTICPL